MPAGEARALGVARIVRSRQAHNWGLTHLLFPNFSAFFEVPWDHLDPSNAEVVSLAVRKLPATVRAHERKGIIFVNPVRPSPLPTHLLACILSV